MPGDAHGLDSIYFSANGLLDESAGAASAQRCKLASQFSASRSLRLTGLGSYSVITRAIKKF